MATTHFAFCAINPDLPDVPYAGGATFEVKTPTASSAATTLAATASQNICRVVTDTQVYVTFAAAPTASAAAGFMCPANSISNFRVKSGDKAAVITAP